MGEANLTRVPSVGRIMAFHTTVTGVSLPAIVTKVHSAPAGGGSSTVVNLKVFHDGPEPDEFVTSVVQGSAPRQWDWPKQV